ncbi:MAG: sugar dehydratase [Elusimicrobia bacterium RIFOXYA1_FULL_47_7]|nr:MAG: sugar dehydratase [Elusimicrobia bacterium RIFOXYA12_FULL_49_49]OGS06019.1 MAG: sugar dehydratase [Elusimicrobia bacterium RIFOXYA1_FULL_47_7]OGS16807.1 MAG: sugar dehydratase [Elusimicrobia bacterium RIFOXYA2_FULL_47_53]OGS32035.1 MAG: sugar dehydratase [Elusimicrobia bacterium RIFOXYB2_FULL_46_23]
MNRSFWKNKKVLITGHEGFLGSNLTRTLLDGGADIRGIDILTKRKLTLFSKEEYKKFRTIKGDIADVALINRVIKSFKPEYIFHLAAEAIVSRSNKNPVRAFKSNIEGTWNLLEACRNLSNVKAIVVASSDKAYGSHKVLPYTESAALKGDHPYDASKSCADLLCYTYFNTYSLPVCVTRCGNIYGPGDFNYSRIVPDAVRCALSGKTLEIRSDGKFTRDYVYVDDIVNGYIMLAEQLVSKKLAGEAFNFSDENPINVIQFTKMIYDALLMKPDYKILNNAKYEIMHQYLSSKKARKILGWKPAYSLKQGIRRTVEWYKNHRVK